MTENPNYNVIVKCDDWVEIFGPFTRAEANRLTEVIQAVVPDYTADDNVYVYCE